MKAINLIALSLPLLLAGCVAPKELVKQHLAALESVNIGNTYIEMITKVGYKPQDYKCSEDRSICTAFYMTNYKRKEFKRFVISDEKVIAIH